jgi:hypothetical protein
MGIGNTTPAACLAQWLTGRAGLAGPGTGLDAAAVARKQAVVDAAVALHAPDIRGPLGALRRLGGGEIAVLCGLALGAGEQGLAVRLRRGHRDGGRRGRRSGRARPPPPACSPATARRSPPTRCCSTTSACAPCSTSACASARAPARPRRWPSCAWPARARRDGDVRRGGVAGRA